MNRNNTFALVLALALGVGAGPAHAQATHGEQAMGGLTMKHYPMMPGVAESPATVLQHTDELGLTPDQVARLEDLRDDAAERRAAAIEEMHEPQGEIDAVAPEETFDEAAAADLCDRMGDLHARMGLLMARTRQAARQVLTVEQCQRVRELAPDHGAAMGSAPGMSGMAGMSMMEMMRRCPMMGGGRMDAGEPGAAGGEG